jgi:hypothetical protein
MRHGRIIHYAHWICLALMLSTPGCSRLKGIDVSVPLKNNAAEQYKYATEYRDSKNLELIIDDKKLALGREVVRQTFAKVYEYFPEDRTFTPLAKLDVIIIEAGLDSPRVKLSRHQRLRAIEKFQELADQYPEYEYIQAMSLYEQGLIFKLLGDRRAMEIFDEVRKAFADTKDLKIRQIVANANRFYNDVYVYE